MTECLGRVAELFAGPRNLLGEHVQMVAERQRVLEDVDRLVQVFLVVLAGLGGG